MSIKIDATERLLNLVIALLGTRRGYSKSYLRENINGYVDSSSSDEERAKANASFERMFERDKKILLELGIPIRQSEVQGNDTYDQVLYRINPDEYRVPAVRLDESAMTLLSIAANLWADASLGAAAQSALRKIATRAGTSWYEDQRTSQSRIRTAERSFEPLWAALRNHHPVTFSYRRTGDSESTHRTVQPLGLGNKYGQWYLAAFDVEKSQERNFRLSRITSDVEVLVQENFERPANFAISNVLARLGTGTAHTAEVAVPVGSANWLRSRAGTEIISDSAWKKDGWDVLHVSFREPELMADDVAAMGAQGLVLAPPEFREAVARRLQGAAKAAAVAPVRLAAKAVPASSPTRKKDSRDRLIRLLSMVPYLVANPGVAEAEVLTEFGISARDWSKDQDTLNVTGLPGYFHGDLMDVSTETGQVFIRDAETLSAPLRLTQEEACSVLVGLQALTSIANTGQEQALKRAIDSVSAVAGPDAWLANVVGLHLVSGTEIETITTLQTAIDNSRACTISYLVRTRDEVSKRVIEPRRLFSVDSLWYVRAWCRQAQELRSFRVDHIKELVVGDAQEHALGDTVSWDSSHGIYHPSSKDIAIDLLTDVATAQRLSPAYNATIYGVSTAGGTDENTDEVTDLVGLRLLVGDTAMLAPLMARLGGHARVAAPETERVAAAAWLAGAAANYDAVGENTPAPPSQGR